MKNISLNSILLRCNEHGYDEMSYEQIPCIITRKPVQKIRATRSHSSARLGLACMCVSLVSLIASSLAGQSSFLKYFLDFRNSKAKPTQSWTSRSRRKNHRKMLVRRTTLLRRMLLPNPMRRRKPKRRRKKIWTWIKLWPPHGDIPWTKYSVSRVG